MLIHCYYNFMYFLIIMIYEEADFYAFSQFYFHSEGARRFTLFRVKKQETTVPFGGLGKDFFSFF